MAYNDKDLGLKCAITRRDLITGLGAVAGAAMLPGKALADAVLAAEVAQSPYPPSLTGLRGNHNGSWEVAHAVAREGRTNWGSLSQKDDTQYDLVIVGAGISGLSAAHFWLKSQPDAKILIIDNHDDFGGHAKRNEFDTANGKLMSYGGSQTLQEPSSYPPAAKELLNDLQIELGQFDTAYDQDFYRRNGLASGIFFDKENWGTNKMVQCELGTMYDDYLSLAPSSLSMAESIAQMPMPENARRQLSAIFDVKSTLIPGGSEAARLEYLSSITYRTFLIKHMGITEPAIFNLLQNLATDTGVGIDTASAESAILYAGLPGLAATGINWESAEPYIHHFPDGNASVARLLVRKMIPNVAPGSTMDDIVLSRFNYDALDSSENPVRLRLNSTVTAVSQDNGDRVNISYVRGGTAHQVRARHCILACYNAVIPSLCPELPAEQREALAMQVKTPILYTSVALRNWQAWKKLGIGAVMAPSSYHTVAKLDFPVSLGGYDFGDAPEQPVVINMERFPHRNNEGLAPKDQYRMGRHELLATPFSTMERNVRSQLTAMLEPGGFDPARDITGITVNRWAHGYSYWYNGADDAWYEDRDDERYPHVRARRRFGKIAIANSDSGANAMLEEAVVQARRAVDELL
ncbi:MAG: spermidine dehydrogenase [Halioglobus sp.]|jgi:spermidine dehydrogenase